MQAVAVLAALHGKTVEEETQSLLDQEEEMRKAEDKKQDGKGPN